MSIHSIALRATFVAGILLALASGDALAQGKSHGKGHGAKEHKHVVTTDRAIIVTREVLVAKGYEVVRVENRDDVRVVYYRAGNKGKGKGKGPVQMMIVRPARERVVIEQAPSLVLADINIRLGL
jgi:hypothetical protein